MDDMYEAMLKINMEKVLVEEKRLALMDFVKVKLDNLEDFMVFKIIADRYDSIP